MNRRSFFQRVAAAFVGAAASRSFPLVPENGQERAALPPRVAPQMATTLFYGETPAAAEFTGFTPRYTYKPRTALPDVRWRSIGEGLG